RIDPHATYLITGGLGALGLHVAHWLADKGAQHLVLTSRSGLPDRMHWESMAAEETDLGQRIAAVRSLETNGVTVTVAQADVADRAQMARLIEDSRGSQKPLRGVFHIAGTVTARPLAALETDTLQATCRPKVT